LVHLNPELSHLLCYKQKQCRPIISIQRFCNTLIINILLFRSTCDSGYFQLAQLNKGQERDKSGEGIPPNVESRLLPTPEVYRRPLGAVNSP
jgi:hypothetical protein